MYGIKTAALSGLPVEVIHEAERIYEKLRSDREIADNSIDQASTTSGSSIINRNLLHHLYVLRYADLDNTGMTSSHVMNRLSAVLIRLLLSGLRRQLQHLRNRFLAPVAESS